MNTNKPFENLFNDDYLYFYSSGFTPERTGAEVNFIESALSLQPGEQVLDVACGHGRHLNELARRGCRCTGVDITPGFLEIARKEATAEGLDVRYLQQDVRKLDFDTEFDAAYCYFTSFGYFNDKENAVVIMNVARALKIGGRFLLESINHDFIVKNGRLHNINERDGNLMLDTSRFDPVKSRIFTRRRIIRDGRDYETGFTVRLYTPPELKQLLGAGGFVIETFYGGRDKPFEVTSPRLVVVARKQS